MAIYAQIDVALPRDPKMLAAGPMARLVYIHCVLYARENLTDGVVHASLLRTACVDVPRPRCHMDRLVAVGLMQEHPDGWQFPEHVWRRWNPTKAQVEAKRGEEAQRKADYRNRKKSGNVPTGQEDVSQRDAAYTRKQPKPEPEPKPEPKPEQESLPSSNGSSSVATNPTRREQIIAEHVRIAKALANDRGHTIRDPDAWTGAIAARVAADPNLERWATMFPTAPADAIAAWLHGDKGSQQYYPTADELAAAEDGPEIADVIEMRWA